MVYDLEIERSFAQGLEGRDATRKLQPRLGDTEQGSDTIYLVREPKGTKDFLKLRTTEADKVRDGKAHFEALGVPF